MTKESIFQRVKNFFSNKKKARQQDVPPQIRKVKPTLQTRTQTKKLLKGLKIVGNFYKRFPDTGETNVRRGIRWINTQLRRPLDFNTKGNLLAIRKGLKAKLTPSNPYSSPVYAQMISRTNREGQESPLVITNL